MDIDEAIAYLQERKNSELAAETTDWEMVQAVDAILRVVHRLDI